MEAHHTLQTQLSNTLNENQLLKPTPKKLFLRLFQNFLQQKGVLLDEQSIKPIPAESCIAYQELEPCPKDPKLMHELLDKLVILKLNGHSGSALGYEKAKSTIEVKPDLAFLDLCVKQLEFLNSVYGTDIPLVVLNSFHTHDDTVRHIRKYRFHNLSIHTFNQFPLPVLYKDTCCLFPSTAFDRQTKDKWFSSHRYGDLFHTIFDSGLLEKILQLGKEYVFISEIDNLGSTVDFNILYHMLTSDTEFIMEARETGKESIGDKNDDETSERIVYCKDKIQAVRPSEMKTKKIPSSVMSTKNIWIHLRTLQRLVAQDTIDLKPVVRYPVVSGLKFLRLDPNIASAISSFKKSLVIKVDAVRHFPVRSSSDLFLVQSSLFSVKHGALKLNPHYVSKELPVVKLGPSLSTLQNYLNCFSNGIPHIEELKQLVISGNVSFGNNVTLKGTVIITTEDTENIDIPDGSILEDKVIQGSMRIANYE